MPYTNVSQLPKDVQNMPEDKRRQWMRVFNNIYDKLGDEGRARAGAYSSIKDDTKKGFAFNVKVAKVDEDERLVYGWASVISKYDAELIDLQGDIISPSELVKAAHAYMTNSRAVKVMHAGRDKGRIVESMVFTDELQKALGVDFGKVGWFIGMKVEDDEAWKMVKSGELREFSIGGRAKRVTRNS